MTHISEVILDVDGTLVDSNDAHASAWIEAMAENGYKVPFDKVRPLIGMGGDKVIAQAYRLGLTQELDEFWRTWEDWFTDMAETHISNSEVIFYRSSQPDTSWITTAGAILDASALFPSTVDRQDVPWLSLCFKAGCRTLNDISADLSILSQDLSLTPEQAIHVTRTEYDIACETLSIAGVPLKVDREESWQAFVNMRVQYDFTLIAMANLIYAPKAPWSSDRKLGLNMRHFIW